MIMYATSVLLGSQSKILLNSNTKLSYNKQSDVSTVHTEVPFISPAHRHSLYSTPLRMQLSVDFIVYVQTLHAAFRPFSHDPQTYQESVESLS